MLISPIYVSPKKELMKFGLKLEVSLMNSKTILAKKKFKKRRFNHNNKQKIQKCKLNKRLITMETAEKTKNQALYNKSKKIGNRKKLIKSIVRQLILPIKTKP